MLAGVFKYHCAETLVRLERGFVNARDDLEERGGVPVGRTGRFELGSCEGAEGWDVVLIRESVHLDV